MHKAEEETSDHILLHCLIVCTLWQLILAFSLICIVYDAFFVRGLLLSIVDSYDGKERGKRLENFIIYAFF